MIFELLAIDPGRFLLAFVVVVIASMPQSLTGMGFGIFAASSLLLIEPTLVPATVIVMGTLVASANALSRLQAIDVPELGLALLGRLSGIALAFPLLRLIPDRETFAALIAAVILLTVFLSALEIAPRKTAMSVFVAGTASGVSGTLTAVGAPPMGIVYQNDTREPASATLNAFFAIGGLMSAYAVWWHGWLAWRDVLLALALLPGLALGTWLSGFLRGVADRNFRPAILAICSLSAVAAIFRSVFQALQ